MSGSKGRVLKTRWIMLLLSSQRSWTCTRCATPPSQTSTKTWLYTGFVITEVSFSQSYGTSIMAIGYLLACRLGVYSDPSQDKLKWLVLTFYTSSDMKVCAKACVSIILLGRMSCGQLYGILVWQICKE